MWKPWHLLKHKEDLVYPQWNFLILLFEFYIGYSQNHVGFPFDLDEIHCIDPLQNVSY